MSNLTKLICGVLVACSLTLGATAYKQRSVIVSQRDKLAQQTQTLEEIHNGLLKDINTPSASEQKLAQVNEELDKARCQFKLVDISLQPDKYHTREAIIRELGAPEKVEQREDVRGSSFGVDKETGRIEIMDWSGYEEVWHYPHYSLLIEVRTPKNVKEQYLKLKGVELAQ